MSNSSNNPQQSSDHHGGHSSGGEGRTPLATGINMNEFLDRLAMRQKQDSGPGSATTASTSRQKQQMAVTFMTDNAQTREEERLKSEDDARRNREFEEMQNKMDSRMDTIGNFVDYVDRNQEAAGNLEHVMGRVEQQNVQLLSTLRASEGKRDELEIRLKEQNKQLTELRPIKAKLKTLQEEAVLAQRKTAQDQETLVQLDADVKESKQREHAMLARMEETERGKDLLEQDHRSQCLDTDAQFACQTTLLEDAQQELVHKDHAVKEVLLKCDHIWQQNKDAKMELSASLESGQQLLEDNDKLNFCKQYLEQQIDQLVQGTIKQKTKHNQLKARLDQLNKEKLLAEREQKLCGMGHGHTATEIRNARDLIDTLDAHLKMFEKGEIRSAVDVSGVNNMRERNEQERKGAQKGVRQAEEYRKEVTDNLKLTELQMKQMKAELVHMQTKMDHYQALFMDKKELTKGKAQLEERFKIDMGAHLEHAGARYERDRVDLSRTIVDAARYRHTAADDFDVGTPGSGVPFQGQRLTLANWAATRTKLPDSPGQQHPNNGPAGGRSAAARNSSYHLNSTGRRRQLDF